MSGDPSNPYGQAQPSQGAPPLLPRPVLPGRRPWWTAMWVSGLVCVLLMVVGVVLVVIAAPANWSDRVGPENNALFLTGMLMAMAGFVLGCVAVPTFWVIDMVKRAT